MPHIHDKDGQHDHSIDMFVFRTDFDEPKLMMHLHRKHHKFMQFGGHIELDENPMQAMRHELSEESGYDPGQVKVLQPAGSLTHLTDAILHPIPATYNTHLVVDKHFHSATYYALVTDEEPANAVREGESTDIQLFSRAELEKLSVDEILDNTKETALYMFDRILPNWEPIELLSFEV